MPSSDDLPPAVPPDVMAIVADTIGIDDAPILLELLDTFLHDAAQIVNTLQEKWAAGKKDEVLRSAHSLKSTSATFQAARLTELSAQLEDHLRDETGTLNVEQHILSLVAEYERVHQALLVEREKLAARQ